MTAGANRWIPSPAFLRNLLRLLITIGLLALLLALGAPGQLSAQSAAVHVVQPGETLSAIARQYGTTTDAIRALNGVEDADAIDVGQRLNIPGSAQQPLEAAPPGTHRVQPGETLSGIAKRYGLTLATLKALNAIGDANRIFVGQELLLTTPAPVPTAPPDAPRSSPFAPDKHTVQTGETLSGIAARYGLTLQQLKQPNGIADENAIYTGQILVLIATETEPPLTATPDAAVDTSTPAAEPTPAPEDIARSGNPIGSLNATYTVRPGDTLGWIALRLGIDPDSLRALNGFADLGEQLVAGQKLLLPATGDELRTKAPSKSYTVKPGETLGAIASAFDVTTADILSANRIADPNAIYSGQELAIPPKAPPGATQVGPARGGYYYYRVQPGDTMSAVAAQFNTTMQAIRAYNGLPDNETLYSGLEVRIPHGAPPLTVRFPPVPRSGHRFIVSLSRQQCWVYQGERLLYAWNCSTGYGERQTKAGNYAVQSRIDNAKSNIWRLDMPYWLGIYDVGPFENGIHGLPIDWDTGEKIWSALIGQPATFGCAMLDDLNAAALYRLAYLGMPVHIIN